MENPIFLDDGIVNDFINGPDEFTRFEEHDIQHLERLCDDTPNLNTSDKDLFKDNFKRATSLNQMGDFGTRINTVYKKKPHSSPSRYAGQFSLVGLSKDLKQNVFYQHGGFQSFDIVNRNYSIINEIAKQNNVHFPTIEDFVNNYERYFNEYQTYWGGFVKQGFANLVAHPIHEPSENAFIKSLVDELKIVHQCFQHPQLPNYTVLQMIEIYSTYIIKCVYEYLVENNIILKEHCVLGNNVILFRPLKDFYKEEVRQKLEQYIFNRTNLHIRFH